MTTEFVALVTFMTADLQTLHTVQCAGMINIIYLQTVHTVQCAGMINFIYLQTLHTLQYIIYLQNFT
jgi:hypothetical protein